MAADARALLDQLGWDRVHVVGHSMGGLIAEQLALDAPERVASLALLCTPSSGRAAARPSMHLAWVLCADEDPIAPPPAGRATAEVIGTARYLELRDAAHGVVIQRAAEINSILAEHFASASSA